MGKERISPRGSGKRSPTAGVHHRPADPTCPVGVLQAPLRRREAPRTVAPRSYCPRIKAGELPEGRAARRRPGGWRLTETLRNPQALVRGGFSCMNLSSHQLKSSTLYLYLQRQGPSTFVGPREFGNSPPRQRRPIWTASLNGSWFDNKTGRGSNVGGR